MTPEEQIALMKSRGFTGGLDDLQKVFDALESAKADITKNKTRADAVTGLEEQLAAFQAEKTARDDADKTELQKLTDRIAKQELDIATANAATAQANRTVLLEKGIAEHLGGIDEKLRPLAQNYMRTVLPGRDWADSEALKAQITETLTGFNELLPEEMRVVASGDPLNKTRTAATVVDKPAFNMHAILHPDS